MSRLIAKPNMAFAMRNRLAWTAGVRALDTVAEAETDE
jgi:hypothetical protein